MPFIVALLVAISSATWIYTRLIRTSGGNTKNTLIVCAISGFLIFLVVFYLASRFLG